MRLEPNGISPNLIGGYSGNSVAAGLVGATISGGGQSGNVNSIFADYSTIGGGYRNTIQTDASASAIGGGRPKDSPVLYGYGGGALGTRQQILSIEKIVICIARIFDVERNSWGTSNA